jgi:hypothetical protein
MNQTLCRSITCEHDEVVADLQSAVERDLLAARCRRRATRFGNGQASPRNLHDCLTRVASRARARSGAKQMDRLLISLRQVLTLTGATWPRSQKTARHGLLLLENTLWIESSGAALLHAGMQN